MKLQDIIREKRSFPFDYLAQDKELAQQIQVRLIALRLLTGTADGSYGKITKTSLERFNQAFNLPYVLDSLFAKKLIETKEVKFDNFLNNYNAIAEAIFTPIEQITTYYPAVVKEFCDRNIGDRLTMIAVLATVRIETGGFKPVREYGGKAYFTKMYEGRKDLGNVHPGDGDLFSGRGYIQITGRNNYKSYGDKISVDLINNPDLALLPENSAKILAVYFDDRNVSEAANDQNWRKVRRLVNGGYNGWNEFERFVNNCLQIL